MGCSRKAFAPSVRERSSAFVSVRLRSWVPQAQTAPGAGDRRMPTGRPNPGPKLIDMLRRRNRVRAWAARRACAILGPETTRSILEHRPCSIVEQPRCSAAAQQVQTCGGQTTPRTLTNAPLANARARATADNADTASHSPILDSDPRRSTARDATPISQERIPSRAYRHTAASALGPSYCTLG